MQQRKKNLPQIYQSPFRSHFQAILKAREPYLAHLKARQKLLKGGKKIERADLIRSLSV